MKVDALSFATRLLHPRHVVIVTCSGRERKVNAITLSWSMPTSFNPPMAVISVAPQRYSHSLIEETGEFVINIPTVELIKQAFQIGSKSGRDLDKFKVTGLTPGKAKVVKPPIIEECVAHLECRVAKQVETGDHTLFIGEVVAAYADEEVFKNKLFNPKAAKPLFHYGLDWFTTVIDEVLKP